MSKIGMKEKVDRGLDGERRVTRNSRVKYGVYLSHNSTLTEVRSNLYCRDSLATVLSTLMSTFTVLPRCLVASLPKQSRRRSSEHPRRVTLVFELRYQANFGQQRSRGRHSYSLLATCVRA